MVIVHGYPNVEEIKRTASEILREIIMKEEVERDSGNMERHWMVQRLSSKQ